MMAIRINQKPCRQTQKDLLVAQFCPIRQFLEKERIFLECVFLNHSRSRSRCVGPFTVPAFASKGENVPVVHYILPSKDEWLRRADQLGALGISPVFLLRIIPRGRGSHKSERGSGGPTVEKGTWESRWNSVGWLGSLLPVQLSLQYPHT